VRRGTPGGERKEPRPSQRGPAVGQGAGEGPRGRPERRVSLGSTPGQGGRGHRGGLGEEGVILHCASGEEEDKKARGGGRGERRWSGGVRGIEGAKVAAEEAG